MTAFRFRLETLLKLRRAERQRRMGELAEAFEAESKLSEQSRQLALQRETTKLQLRVGNEPGKIDVNQLLEVHRYELVLQAQEQVVLQQRSQLNEEIERRRSVLAEAERQVKVLEKLRENQHDEHVREELRKEQIDLDEVAQTVRTGDAR